MYGLMQAHLCSRPTQEPQTHRLHYCGTCKTMGRLYGQKARFLLNHDAVFLAELLTALAPQSPPVTEWSGAYQSYNCFTLPHGDADMPLSLQIAAAATLLMTEFKVSDQITDGSATWKMARKTFAAEFLRASEQLQAWGFPVETLWEWGRVQDTREAEARERRGPQSAVEMLDRLAEPTATVTGLMFQHGAAAMGRDRSIQEDMYVLGAAFGALIYVLDACEDYEKDARRNHFNALQSAFQTSELPYPLCYRTATRAHVAALQGQVEAALHALPLPLEQARKFADTLRSNLARKFGEREEATSCAAPASRPSLPAQYQSARSLARTLTARHREQNPDLAARLTLPAIFASTLTIALFFPRQALTATSYRECRDIAFNLIFLGGAVSNLATVPGRLVPAFALSGAGSPLIRLTQGSPTRSSSRRRSGQHGESSTTFVEVRRRRGCCGGCGGCGDGCGECCCDLACCEGINCCGEGCCCACEGCEACGTCGMCG